LSFSISLVRIPLSSPFSNSRGTTLERSALILRLAHGGIEAVSECATDETLSSTGEDNETAARIIKEVLGGMLRAGPSSPKGFLEAARSVAGNPMAKAAVEMLLWDYMGKAQGEPLDEAIGESRGRAEAGIALGLWQDTEMKSLMESALIRGYKRIKVKIERQNAFEKLKTIRDTFPQIPLSADANGCFEFLRDMATLKRIDELRLQYLEQPFGYGHDDVMAHSRLAKEISTPICLDESVMSVERAEEILDSGAASVINIKPGRVGGLTAAMEIAHAARRKGAHVWVGGMLETGIGRAFNVALASQRPFDYPGDTSPNDRYFKKDVVMNPFVMKDGSVRPNRGPGAGVELDRDYLDQVTTQRWEVF
jgi:O-succinylbenzoate synthase